jgi:hypothetical protein
MPNDFECLFYVVFTCFDMAGRGRKESLHCVVKGPWEDDDDDERVDLSFAKGPSFLYPGLQLLPHLSESMPPSILALGVR